MEFISVFFIILSLIVLFYFLSIFKSKKRIHLIFELFFLTIYSGFLIIVIYPFLLSIIENFLGIQSAINFIIYLSIFIAYFILFILYNQLEEQRKEITTLIREVAILVKKKGGKK